MIKTAGSGRKAGYASPTSDGIISSDDYIAFSNKVDAVASSLTGIQVLTQEEYAAIEEKDPLILYAIKDVPQS